MPPSVVRQLLTSTTLTRIQYLRYTQGQSAPQVTLQGQGRQERTLPGSYLRQLGDARPSQDGVAQQLRWSGIRGCGGCGSRVGQPVPYDGIDSRTPEWWDSGLGARGSGRCSRVAHPRFLHAYITCTAAFLPKLHFLAFGTLCSTACETPRPLCCPCPWYRCAHD